MDDGRHPQRGRGRTTRGMPHRSDRQRQRDRIATGAAAHARTDRAELVRGSMQDRAAKSDMTPTIETPWKQMGKMLCIRLKTLGDAMMATPALRALRQLLPETRLALRTPASGAAAAGHIPESDDAVVATAPWACGVRGCRLPELRKEHGPAGTSWLPAQHDAQASDGGRAGAGYRGPRCATTRHRLQVCWLVVLGGWAPEPMS